MTGKGISCKAVFFIFCSMLWNHIRPNRLYKQTCNVAFFYNNFNLIFPFDMTFIAGCSLVAASFEREDARMCPFTNLTCDY